MGRLRTLTILLTLGAWGAATDGAPPDNAGPATEAAARPPAPVPPVDYLKTGARLFNNGQYDLAAKYIGAAESYRDKLSSYEQTVLDAYLKEMAKAPRRPVGHRGRARGDGRRPRRRAGEPGDVPAPAAEPGQAQAAAAARPGGDQRGRRRGGGRPRPRPRPRPRSRVGPRASDDGSAPPVADAKAQARWLLAASREQIRAGNYDDAAAKVAQARAMNVRWGLFDDTPTKVAASIEKARPKAVVTTAPTASPRTAPPPRCGSARPARRSTPSTPSRPRRSPWTSSPGT